MKREKKLFNNILIFLLGNFGSKFLGILILPLYTHYLTKNQYGYFDLITTYITLLMPLITLQITDALYRYLLDSKHDLEMSKVITNSLNIIFCGLLFLNITGVILFQFIYFEYQYLFLIQLNFMILYSIWIQIARGLKQNILYAVSGIIFTVVTLVSTIIMVVYLNYEIKGLIFSNIFAAIFTMLIVEYRLKIIKRINFKLNSKIFKLKLLKFSLPLMPNVVSWWIMNVSDRTLLNFYIGMEANGIYAISNKFASIIFMLNSIFSLAWQESVITEYKEKGNREFYSKMFNLFVKFQLSGVIVFLAFTKLLMDLLISEEFYTAWKYIPFLYIASVFSGFSSFYGASYLSSEKTLGSFYSSILGALLNVVVNICLIPLIGIQGAALSTLLAFLVMWIARIINTKKFFSIKIDYKDFLTLFVITGIFTYLYYFENTVLERTLMFFSLIIFAFYNKSLLIQMKNSLMGKLKRN